LKNCTQDTGEERPAMAAKSKIERSSRRSILLVEAEVIVRLGLAQYLRDCVHTVLEAASALEAKSILQAGKGCDVLLCDAELAHGESGFALARWTRRYRPKIKILLTASLNAKTLAAAELCGDAPFHAASRATALQEKIRLMLAERARRARRSAATIRPRVRRLRS
jgi:CheY-like chemotaxis protein